MNQSKRTIIRLLLALAALFCVGGCALWDAANGPSSGAHADAEDLDAGDLDAAEDTDALHDTKAEEDGVDADMSGDGSDALPEDASPDVVEPLSCAGTPVSGIFALDPAEGRSQGHISAAFDGTGIWVVYAVSLDGSSDKSDLYAARILCDGTVDISPQKVNQDSIERSAPRSRIDIRDETVHLVWSDRDTGSSIRSISYLRFAADGDEISSAVPKKVLFNFSNLTLPVQDLNQPDVVGLGGGNAAIAATASLGSSQQVFVQQLDPNGDALSPAIAADLNEDFAQAAPSIAGLSSKQVWLTWAQNTVGETGEQKIAYRWLNLEDPGGSEETRTVVSGLNPGAYSPFSENIVNNEQVYFTYGALRAGRATMAVKNAASSGEVAHFGEEGNSNTWPVVAARPAGGALAWYSSRDQVDESKIFAQAFQYEEPVELTGGPVQLNSTGVILPAQGAPSLVYVGGGNYFVAWPQKSAAGGKPQIMWRFVNFDE